MQFLAVVRYSHGAKITHEFRCPLERQKFVESIKAQDPQAKIRLRQRRETDDCAPAGEAQWYGGDA